MTKTCPTPSAGLAVPANTVAVACWLCADAGTAPTAATRPSAAVASCTVRRTVTLLSRLGADCAGFVLDGRDPADRPVIRLAAWLAARHRQESPPVSARCPGTTSTRRWASLPTHCPTSRTCRSCPPEAPAAT